MVYILKIVICAKHELAVPATAVKKWVESRDLPTDHQLERYGLSSSQTGNHDSASGTTEEPVTFTVMPYRHATSFVLGALLGGGLATSIVLAGRKRQLTTATTSSGAVVQVDTHGTPQMSSDLASMTALTISPVLGNPGPIADVLVRKGYIAAYDRRLRHPAWTAEHLTLASLGRSATPTTSAGEDPSPMHLVKADRSKSEFKEDDSLPIAFRARLQDYFKSGYDRGHMVPAADVKLSQDAMDETFLLSNIAPQVGEGFNRHYWAYLEDWCRRLTHGFSDVYIFTVPLYLPHREADGKWRVTYEVIGSPPNVAVPTHFAKVVLAAKPSSPETPHILDVSTGAFVLPNAAIPDETPLENFVSPVEMVEHAAGLSLFSHELKSSSKHICKTTKCQVIVRRFDDARKRSGGLRRTKSTPS